MGSTERGRASHVATVPRLRNPTRQSAARSKKTGCFARDDREARYKTVRKRIARDIQKLHYDVRS